jgi:hypothetical protein
MAKERQRGGESFESGPPRMPSGNPPIHASSADYSLATMQVVMEMQKTLGGLTQAVNTLTDQHKDQAAKLNKIEKQIYAFIAIVFVLGAILTFFSKFTNDWLFHKTQTPAAQQQPPEHK